ncbi:MAG: single-stranded DNA-binding protein [Rhodanobacter sp.]
MSLNSVHLIGYVGQDPSIRYMPNGDPVAELSLATTDTWTDKESGERKEATEWHRIKLYGKNLIENFVSKYVKKGSLVHIEGKLRTRDYEDKNDKIRRWVTEIRANEIQLLDRKPKDAAPPSDLPAGQEIPF